jgi:hypothetical protein
MYLITSAKNGNINLKKIDKKGVSLMSTLDYNAD